MYPLGADEDQAAAIYAKIEAMNDAVTAALEEYGETGVYVSPIGADYVEVHDMMQAYLQYAEAMQGYNEDIAQIHELSMAFQELVDTIDEMYPLGVDDEQAAAISAKIEAMNDAVNAALEDYEETGVYVSPLGADYKEVFDMMQAYLQYAESAQAYTEDVEQINEIAQAYQEMVDTIEAEYPMGVDEEMAAAIYAKIEAMNDAMTEALEQYEETGVYVSPLGADYKEVFDMMQEYMQKAAILQAYNEDLDTIKEWTDALMEIINGTFTINEEGEDLPFEGYAKYREDEIAALNNQILSYSNAVESALGQADETGVYFSPLEENGREVTEAIMSLITEGQEMYMNILNATMEDMGKLYEYYDQIAEAIDGDDADPTEDQIALMARLIELSNAVNEAQWTALNETAIYESPLTEEVIAELDEMLKAAGISSAIADSNEAIYYDLNGNRIAHPAAGKIYIQVVNGKATKIVK